VDNNNGNDNSNDNKNESMPCQFLVAPSGILGTDSVRSLGSIMSASPIQNNISRRLSVPTPPPQGRIIKHDNPNMNDGSIKSKVSIASISSHHQTGANSSELHIRCENGGQDHRDNESSSIVPKT